MTDRGFSKLLKLRLYSELRIFGRLDLVSMLL